MSIELMTVGALSGLGRTRLSSTISVILTGSRIPLALILTHAGMGLNGVWWALTISSIVKGIVFTLTFRHISRRLPEKDLKIQHGKLQKRTVQKKFLSVLFLLFLLFRNKVYDLVRYINLFDKVLAFQEGSNSLVCFGDFECFFFFTSVRDYDCSSYFTVYLYTDLNGLGNCFAFIVFRPFGNCQ